MQQEQKSKRLPRLTPLPLRLMCLIGSTVLALASTCPAPAQSDAPAPVNPYDRGRKAVESMAGCYLTDYSYVETEALQPGYERDPRVYDVNKNKSVKEWIYAEEISSRRLRLQHVLFMTDLNGQLVAGSELKHQAEDWEFEAPFLYDFTGPSNWAIKDLRPTHGLWTRRITALDDGLRYQCASSWTMDTMYPEWTCSNYAPIPGRETRDMGRKDYNTLERTTRLIAYGTSWLERQENVKTIDQNSERKPLAKELGKPGSFAFPMQSANPPETSRTRARPSGPWFAKCGTRFSSVTGPSLKRNSPASPIATPG